MSIVINALIGFANLSTISVSGFMKVPQVYSLIKSKSAVGVSLTGLLLELAGYCIMMSYNFYAKYPLASYFEYPLLVSQDVVMLLVMLNLLNLYSPTLLIPFAAFILLMFSIGWGYLPTTVIALLVSLCTVLSASSKVIQLSSILSKKDSTGVSVASWLISAYTCVTRLFTIYIESFDISLMLNFFVNLVLNMGIILAAKVYSPKEKTHSKRQD